MKGVHRKKRQIFYEAGSRGNKTFFHYPRAAEENMPDFFSMTRKF